VDASLSETHVSVLFFVGERAYKLKKPVHFDFVDQSTRERRLALCEREVELNRRLAPDVYEGVATLNGVDGEPEDHLVVMKRLPPDRRLSSLARRGDPICAKAIDDVATILASFHAGADRGARIDERATPAAVAALWEANFDQMRQFVGPVLDSELFDRAQSLATAFVAGRSALFDERIAGGFVCDGHGDLLTDDIFVLEDGPRIIDCLEFSDELRFADVVADLAFLAMDLERIGAVDLATQLVTTYEERSGAPVPQGLLDVWVAYRAQVRSMVACLRWEQDRDPDAAAQAALLLAICASHLERSAVRLVLVGGLPGTGKSTVARSIGDELDVAVLRTDVVRKELVGLAGDAHAPSGFGSGLYRPEQTDRTYDEVLRRAEQHLERGRSVVVDASFAADHHRRAARELARSARATVVELRCEVAHDVAAQRIRVRQAAGIDPSDADEAVATRMAAAFDPWPEATSISTAGPEAESRQAAVDVVTRAVLLDASDPAPVPGEIGRR
jgi:aminoglycoside phosphotransferase family enzyme/predicted kinase